MKAASIERLSYDLWGIGMAYREYETMYPKPKEQADERVQTLQAT